MTLVRTTMLALASAGAAATAALAAQHAKPPAKDWFSGTIKRGTRQYKQNTGAISVVLFPGPTTGATRNLAIRVRGRRCEAIRHCLDLTGTVHGTITATAPSVPDVGLRFTIKATGTVRPIGKTSIRGSVHGTGFILRGHERLTLTFSAADGTLTMRAQSGVVPGFTSP